MPALLSRHFPLPELSTVVAPSGGVQRSALTRERGSGHRTTKPTHNEWVTPPRGRSHSHLNCGPFRFLLLLSIAAPSFGGVKTTMGCKQYNRMLGLSRAYPYILYLSLNKWDAVSPATFPQAGLSRLKLTRREKQNQSGGHDCKLCHPSLAWLRWRGRLSPGRSLRSLSRQYLGPRLHVRNRKPSPIEQRQLLHGETHGNIDILENSPGRDAIRAVGGLHQIITGLTAMFTPERVAKLQRNGELFGSDEKPRPIDLPSALCIRHLCHPWGER